jgi:2-oxoisovalerate dehydrogenase E1 component alpha subunit
LVEAKVYRLTPHSSDDDDRTYRSREEVEEFKQRDPLHAFRAVLLERKALTPEEDAALEARAKEQVEEAVRAGEAAPYPEISEAAWPVYVEDKPHG